MRQITLHEPGRFADADVPPPSALPTGHTLVRVRRVGVCGTDLHAFAGRQPFFEYPRILGHELAVEVLAVAPGVTRVRPGDRCAVEPYLSCGHCRTCTVGRTNCCESLRVLGVHTDGGMRGLLALPADRLHPSDTLTDDQLALVETLGIGYHAVRRGSIRPGEGVLVVGAGPIGLAVVQFAVAAGGRVTVLDVSADRRRFAERFGVAAVAEDGEQWDVVFDATGNAKAMEASFSRVAFGGRLVFVGLTLGRVSFDDPLFHRREMTLLASRNSAGAFGPIMEAVAAGRLDTSPWVTDRLRLRDVPAEFAGLAGRPGLVKAMVDVDDGDC